MNWRVVEDNTLQLFLTEGCTRENQTITNHFHRLPWLINTRHHRRARAIRRHRPTGVSKSS
jgi:hypothetical protein